MINIRQESKADYLNVDVLLVRAFAQLGEANLVKHLRDNQLFIPELSLVAEVDGKVVGYILLFPITITSEHDTFKSLALAPVAVEPDSQRRGVGAELIRESLGRAKSMGFESVIVLGHHEYYPRFGFIPASKWDIRCPFDVPDEAFMALELTHEGLSKVSGIVQYPEEFNAL